MKCLIFSFSLIVLTISSIFSQNVGINSTGATPNTSAMLDIVSTSSGLLVPRMTNAQKNAITVGATQDGLLVYQTDAGTKGIGFYYYSNAAAAWLPFISGWSLTGNAGTAIATNFMGSTDAVDVIFKSAGAEVMRMGNAKTNLMITSNANIANTTDFLSSIANATLNGAGFYTSNTKHGVYAKVTGASTGNAIYAESQSTTADALVAKITNASSGSNAITADVTGGDGTGNALYAVSTGKVGYSTLYTENTPVLTAGTGFDITASHHAVGAQINLPSTTPSYGFAIHGEVSGHSNPCGAVIGYYAPAAAWGALGYRNIAASANYGIYSTTAFISGTGRMSSSSDNAMNIGIGAHGNEFGGWIKGNVYGLAVKGDRVSLYVDGKTIVNQPIIQLGKTADNAVIINYTPASVTADLQVHGVAKMQNGLAIIDLDNQLLNQFLSREDITIIATPSGQTNGVYAELRGSQLIIKENNNGKASVKINWIIIGQRNIDMSIPTEISDKDFDANLNILMHNENDKTVQPESIYWNGTKLSKGQSPK